MGFFVAFFIGIALLSLTIDESGEGVFARWLEDSETTFSNDSTAAVSAPNTVRDFDRPESVTDSSMHIENGYLHVELDDGSELLISESDLREALRESDAR